MISVYNREFERILEVLEALHKRIERLEGQKYPKPLFPPRTEQEAYARATGIRY